MDHLVCEQPGCFLAQNGICLEGVTPPSDCPHAVAFQAGEAAVGQIPSEIDDQDEEPELELESAPTPPDWIHLSTGDELTMGEARAITARHPAILVVLAGEPDAGKTTFISTLYEQFSKGPFRNFQFAGSKTLMAFERSCFLSRTCSEREKADTERTKGVAPRFFHLSLQHGGDQHAENVQLLLADVSGEAYKRALNATDDAKKLSFIRRADSFVLLLDGERLAISTEREDVLQRGLLLLRSLFEAGVLYSQSSITVVIGKWDCLAAPAGNTQAFLGRVSSEFQRYARTRFRRLEIANIAARPAAGDLSDAFGVGDLFVKWLRPAPIPSSSLISESLGRGPNSRESDLFLWRHFATRNK